MSLPRVVENRRGVAVQLIEFVVLFAQLFGVGGQPLGAQKGRHHRAVSLDDRVGCGVSQHVVGGVEQYADLLERLGNRRPGVWV